MPTRTAAALLAPAAALLALAGCKGSVDMPPPDPNTPRVAAEPPPAEGEAAAPAGGENPDEAAAKAAAGEAPAAKPKPKPKPTGPIDEADEDAPAAVAAPRGATPGDVLGPPPRPAPRLGKGGPGGSSAPLEPETPCDQLAPDANWKLANRWQVERRPEKAGQPNPTLELCLFHKWLPRGDADKQGRTGRQHLYVAAFPGAEVAAWTSDELEFAPKSLPADAPVGASGWASLVPTGLHDIPALAVVSGRFYDGEDAEVVHYRRVGRVLRQSRGRWAWVELETLDAASLDLAHVDALCAGDAPGERCADLTARAEAWRKAAAARETRRTSRLGGKAVRAPGKEADGDPQSAWLQQARAELGRKKAEAAALDALRVEMACGEAVREARDVLAGVAKLRGGAETVDPRVKAVELCEPVADKGGPPRK